MRKSTKNLAIIQNFILHLTHCSDDDTELDFKRIMEFTPEVLYQVASDYIEEDHVDGKGNPEDHIVTYSAESSFKNEDIDKNYPEHIVVVADFGDDVGTQTVATLSNIGDLEPLNKLLEFTKNAWKYKYNNL